MTFDYAVVAEWQTRCLQVAVIIDRAGSTPANRTTICPMDETLIERLKQWNINSVLPLHVGDFKLRSDFCMITEDGKDKEYRLFTYVNDDKGWSVRAVLNPSSEEFSIRTDIGMLEFALIEFITDDFDMFRHMVETRLERIIDTYYVHVSKEFSIILKNKGIPDVEWDSFLPADHKGLRRLIKPNDAIRIINGSYMILSYYDSASQSGLSLMYNILRDDFFAERRIHNFPNLVHDFDSRDINDLKQLLQDRLVPVLDVIAATVAEKS